MNARIPARSTGMWGQVKQHHVLAAFGGAVLMVAGVGAAIAVAQSDGSSDRSAARGPVSTFDYIEYTSSAMAEPVVVPDVSAGPRDLRSRAAEITINEVNAGVAQAEARIGARAAEISVTEAPELLSEAAFIEAAIAEHNAAFPELDAGSGGTTGGSVERSARYLRGHVTVD